PSSPNERSGITWATIDEVKGGRKEMLKARPTQAEGSLRRDRTMTGFIWEQPFQGWKYLTTAIAVFAEVAPYFSEIGFHTPLHTFL
ncbi:MAG: hypothetical protein VKK04_22215, partial [Synechococcales bacterium]|nr:hypothetical protein [Synechococcales bacterium]